MIRTTHIGSLPRPDDLIRTMFAKQEGVPIDPVALEARTRSAVAETVRKQLELVLRARDRLTGMGERIAFIQAQCRVKEADRFPAAACELFARVGRPDAR